MGVATNEISATVLAVELTWPEALARVQSVGYRTATGTLRYRLDGDEQGELRFRHRVPDQWRVEDERGVWHVAAGRRQLVRGADGLEDLTGTHLGFGRRHPDTLLVRRDWLREFPTPGATGAPVEVAGRQAWEFVLPAVEGKRRASRTRCGSASTPRPAPSACCWRYRDIPS